MREIKFRAWCPIESRMIIDPMYYEKNFDSDNNCPYKIYEDFRELEDGMYWAGYLMQYTGLKDKNGKEIYEGDILHSLSKAKSCIVKWEQQACQFWLMYENGKYQELTATYGDENLYADTFEVIGNIYENPELLTNG